eukprot:366549-Chlamydomonas_euryale.AAC.12
MRLPCPAIIPFLHATGPFPATRPHSATPRHRTSPRHIPPLPATGPLFPPLGLLSRHSPPLRAASRHSPPQGLFSRLRGAGYNLGAGDADAPACADGEALVAALAAQDDQRAISEGARGIERRSAAAAAAAGMAAAAAEVPPSQLKGWLKYPEEWGPTEWGPIPYLPDNDVLVQRMEKQWGDLRSYR